jgi:hypothetical protein
MARSEKSQGYLKLLQPERTAPWMLRSHPRNPRHLRNRRSPVGLRLRHMTDDARRTATSLMTPTLIPATVSSMSVRSNGRILVAAFFGVMLGALCHILPAQEATPLDSAASQAQGRREVPRPVEGQTIRIFTPTLPTTERRLSGQFLGIDASSGTPTLSLQTTAGARFVPCSLIEAVQVRSVRHTPLWQKAAWTLAGAWGGLYLGHLVGDSPAGISAEDPPVPHPERERAAHRRQNRIEIGGTILGAGIGYFAVRDSDRWRSATLGSCGR